MTIQKRLLMCRLIEKIEKDESYASRLGIRNVSAFCVENKLENYKRR